MLLSSSLQAHGTTPHLSITQFYATRLRCQPAACRASRTNQRALYAPLPAQRALPAHPVPCLRTLLAVLNNSLLPDFIQFPTLFAGRG